MIPRAVLAVALAAGLAFPLRAQRTVFLYQEDFGEASWVGRYEIFPSGSGMELVYTGGPSTHRFCLDRSLDNLEWSWEGADGTARAERRGATIFAEGVLKGKIRKSEKDIGDLPWYQALDYSIGAVASSSTGTRQAFWMVLPEDLSFHMMCVRNAGADTFDLGGKAVPATRLVLSASGVPEALWKNEYWYSTDGVYLGFRGKRGGPFAPIGSLKLLSVETFP